MSKPREPWWGYMKACARAYPAQRKALERAEAARMAGKDTETVEKLLARELSTPQRKRECEAVRKALEATRELPDGAAREKMIALVFLSATHTLSGAALDCYISYATAKRWQSDFLRLIAANLDLT